MTPAVPRSSSLVATCMLAVVGLGAAGGPERCESPGAAAEAVEAPGGTRGLSMLQSRTRQETVQLVDSEEVAGASAGGCRGENENPFWPTRGECCAGLSTCGPYKHGQWSYYLCRSSCEAVPAPAPPAPPADELDDCGCRVGQNGWSSTRGRCSSHSETSPEEAAECRQRRAAPGSSQPGPPPSGEGVLGLMTWNVYFGNNKFGAMSDMLHRYNPDIANLQETNNKLDRIADASGYVSANTWGQKHDWCGYNFHRGDWEHRWAAEIDVPGSRGVCGSMMQRNGTKLCVWGLHPVQNGNNVKFSKESIRLAADKMKECSSQHGAASVFMGDFNTADWRGAKAQLEESTGWGWTLAAKNHIDFIFIQTSPLSVGRVLHSQVVGHGCIPGFPGKNTRTASCGWSDHNPVFAQIQLS